MSEQKKTSSAKSTGGKTAAAKSKNTANTKNTAKKNTSAKSTQKYREEAAPMPSSPKKERNPDSLLHQFIPCILVVSAIVLCVFLAVPSNEAAGAVGGFIRMCSYGLFGWGAWLLPLFMCICAFMWKRTVSEGSIRSLFGFSLGSVIILSALLHAIVTGDSELVFNPITLFSGIDGKVCVGGAIGGFISNILIRSIQKIATFILLICGALILIMFTLRLTPRTILLYIRYKRTVALERARERNEQLEQEYEKRAEEYELRRAEAAHTHTPEKDLTKSPRKAKKNILLSDDDLPEGKEALEPNLDDTDEQQLGGGIEINMFADAKKENSGSDVSSTLDPITEDKADHSPIDDIDLRQVLIPPEQADILPEPTVDDANIDADLPSERHQPQTAEDDGLPPFDTEEDPQGVTLEPQPLEATSEQIGSDTPSEQEAKPEKTEKKKIYRFPPLSILAKAAPTNEAGAQEELAQNARKLVDTLMSFKVKTKILSVSRGPTITRYELSPEAGTRVRSIANLVDDIALNLATSGVRIEAPIPGKSAVGIEVPNKTVSTVRLRELIDSAAFRNAESKINVALGVDVAGTPVYCNIAKMPHMLIAGATGMGKSVCINSIISSILYKANPEEVKLILVDPKKVEFNIYNGLPHLLVPVVSDPQKAAGSLNWAVGEMERRFTLIDEVGVRDIGGYNEVAKGDPDREPMPYVVIIIDELADLMMTAPDAVETSICRLAQKARAAGMHLVIGTQRPSVDVITGLIKANIPSRIAFTVASQVDSKTIIDIGGAEKLIGRGDMLYAPVGFMKPLRVQGAFVSDEEVRAITDFIRSEGGFIEYDPEIISSIEREAERCTQKGKGGSADFDEDELKENVDPKFREALEVAVNSGKISTSLLQRHLSIGYGRAAKIIDRMQALGYVSPPDGQKPRDVLITKQMYMEMVVNGEEV